MDKSEPRSAELSPPSYNEEDVQVALEGVVGGVGDTATMHDDGRIDIDVDSRLSRTLSKLVTIPPDSQDTAPPPDYIRFASPDQFPLRLNIVIQVVGSRGDVQPFVALGNGLQKYGHRVRLATHAKFESFVHDAGLEFYPIGGDPEDLMSYMVKNPGLMPSMKSLRAGDISRKRQMIVEMLEGCWSSCIDADSLTGDPFVADAIIANPPSFAHMHCAEALGIPLHMMFTMPWTATSSFPHPLANITNGKKNLRAANYLSYVLVEIMTWQGLGDVINDWRKKIGLEPVPNTEGPMLASTLSIPFTYCWSPALIPKPKDWPAHIDVSGFFFRGAPDYTPPKALADFLAAGPPPVYIGFGSIVLDNAAAMSSLVLEAITVCGLRAIISHGWSHLDGPARPDVYWLDDCPHEWLFQHVSAVVHHGGAGTAACGLRNSRPTVVVPFFGDQPFWGDMIAAAGAGPSPIPHKTLTAEKLADALRFCLEDAAQTAAAGIAAQMAKEDGVQAAVLSFLNNLPVEKMRCDFLPDQPASWTVKVNKKTKRVSRVAAEILARDEGVDVKNFKPYRPNPILIENHRWDPVTSTTSSAIGIGADMFTATSNIFLKPAEEYRRGRSRSAHPSSSKTQTKSKSRPCSPTSSVKSSTASSNLNPSATTDTATCSSNPNLAATMALASTKSLAHVLASYTKGILVDLPLATAEGFRSAPRLWNSPVAAYGPPITDAQSGFLAAGTSLVLGLRDGARDLAREPVAGAKREGFWGGVKGLGRGGGSFVAKSVSAGLGVVAYPGLGISRSLWAMTHGEAGRVVAERRWGEGRWVGGRVGGGERRRVVQAYYEMNLGKGMS